MKFKIDNNIYISIISGLLFILLSIGIYYLMNIDSSIRTIEVDVAILKTEVKILTKNQDRSYNVDTSGKKVDNLAQQDIIINY